MMSRRQAQQGLGIIEVLVALVVVSFGVLGMASLQLTSMKHSTGGYHRSKATLFASDMATRMRINPPAVDAFAYAAYDSDDTDCDTLPVPFCQATTTSAAVACSVGEMAAFDLFALACGAPGTAGADQGVKDALPGGRLQIICDDSPCALDSMYSIDVSWRTSPARDAQDDNLQLRRVQMRLQP